MIAEPTALSAILEQWPDRFEDALVERMLWRLGVAKSNPEADLALVGKLLGALETRTVTIDRLFFDWRGGRDLHPEVYSAEPFRALSRALEGRARAANHPYWSEEEPCSMHIEEVEAIWSAIADDDNWKPFEDKVRAIRRMGEAMAGGE